MLVRFDKVMPGGTSLNEDESIKQFHVTRFTRENAMSIMDNE